MTSEEFNIEELSKSFNEAEYALYSQGKALNDQINKKYIPDTDPIAKEIVKYQRMYGKRWLKKYFKHAHNLAVKEQNKVKRSLGSHSS